ncbi:MAG TPA: SDR family oxidoreductase [Candidatus Marinimicrobia bacterium]|jgi:NAD(P)-dependent dehydrogenase (short-subunit alcohol dehydrogenase family)|nr:SDR family oxidoreductase [Candidatus Neomarinimicrobiota bacterium]
MNLKNKNIVITGGADGIGKALAKRFLNESPNSVHLIDINPNVLHVAELMGVNAYIVDVSNPEHIKSTLNEIIDQVGKVDLFCSNAGIQQFGTLSTSDEAWHDTWQVNVMSHIYAARVLIPHMLDHKDGYFLITVSAAGLLNMPGSMAYATTKHAAIGMAENLSIMYGDKGIKVSALCPQLVETNMVTSTGVLDKDHPLMRDGLLTAEQVADDTVEGIAKENFLILPHKQILRYIQVKAHDYDAWLAGVRKLILK